MDALLLTAIVGAGAAMACLLAMTYVYRFRGRARYDSLRQYLRKSWPVFALPNVLLYLSTKRRARGPYVNLNNYRYLSVLSHYSETIRDEALALQHQGGFEDARQEGTPASYDVGFRTFYKYGWSRYYLSWYGYTHPSAKASCPRTLEILSKFPEIKGAMFAVLPPRSGLTPHADPLACSLRYHLGLATPNSEDCFINVDGTESSWRDGEAFVFDETYLHFVRNDTDQPRLILMCDVVRPMHLPGRMLNAAYSLLARAALTPNDARDRRGPASALFANVAPLLVRARLLRESNRPAYNALKWGINLTLLGLVLGLVGGAPALALWLINL